MAHLPPRQIRGRAAAGGDLVADEVASAIATAARVLPGAWWDRRRRVWVVPRSRPAAAALGQFARAHGFEIRADARAVIDDAEDVKAPSAATRGGGLDEGPRQGQHRMIPTLDELAVHPERALGLERDQALGLLARSTIAQSALMARVLAAVETVASPPDATASRWLTADDVARRTGFTIEHVRELCRRGVIPSVKQGKYRRIPEDGFRDWQTACGLDKMGSVTLPSIHDPGRGTPRPQGPRAVAVEIRRVARRPSGDGQEVGDGGTGHARDGRPADPPAPRAEGA